MGSFGHFGRQHTNSQIENDTARLMALPRNRTTNGPERKSSQWNGAGRVHSVYTSPITSSISYFYVGTRLPQTYRFHGKTRNPTQDLWPITVCRLWSRLQSLSEERKKYKADRCDVVCRGAMVDRRLRGRPPNRHTSRQVAYPAGAWDPLTRVLLATCSCLRENEEGCAGSWDADRKGRGGDSVCAFQAGGRGVADHIHYKGLASNGQRGMTHNFLTTRTVWPHTVLDSGGPGAAVERVAIATYEVCRGTGVWSGPLISDRLT